MTSFLHGFGLGSAMMLGLLWKCHSGAAPRLHYARITALPLLKGSYSKVDALALVAFGSVSVVRPRVVVTPG